MRTKIRPRLMNLGFVCRNIVRFIGVGCSSPGEGDSEQRKGTCYIVEEYVGGGGIVDKLEMQVRTRLLRAFS